MSFQSEFQEAGEEYARQLDKQRADERLAALTLEARKEGNASAFALAFEAALSQRADDTDTQEN